MSIQEKDTTILLRDYARDVKETDRFPQSELKPILLGLFGEVGSVMATAKKHHREKDAYAGYRSAVEEELGDALWYLTALCRRLNIGVEEVFSEAVKAGGYPENIAANDIIGQPISHVARAVSVPDLDTTLLKLGEALAALLSAQDASETLRDRLRDFVDWYIKALQISAVAFSRVVQTNRTKVRGRFIDPVLSDLPTFDSQFPEEERIPEKFEIEISQRASGKCHLRWNGVFIGDPLTDNIQDSDGYRFHDVFHFAHAAILHWSPTFRALIKQKRKSDPIVDEAQDGGRAIVVEEGLTAWIFARAKELRFFEGIDSVSFDMLKTIQQFVSGYEVESCPLKLWEKAILDGYNVFRNVRENKSGTVIGDRSARTIAYKPPRGI
ncbi:MAG: nucleoside triphosphate pyrophosphohydrolase family protein [Rhodospirillales bacterium]